MIFFTILPASKHFKSYPIRFSRFKESFVKNLADSKLRLLFSEGFMLMGCFVTVLSYISYHLLEKPFKLLQTWIGLIPIAYIAGIYSSPHAVSWCTKFGRDKLLPAILMTMLIGLWLMLIPSIEVVLLGGGCYSPFHFLLPIQPQVVGY